MLPASDVLVGLTCHFIPKTLEHVKAGMERTAVLVGVSTATSPGGCAGTYSTHGYRTANTEGNRRCPTSEADLGRFDECLWSMQPPMSSTSKATSPPPEASWALSYSTEGVRCPETSKLAITAKAVAGPRTRETFSLPALGPDPAIGLGPQPPFELHKAPDLRPVHAKVPLDLGSQCAESVQIPAEQLSAPFQRSCDRPADVWIPMPHLHTLVERTFE
jgi:hypothetical protein